MIHQSLTGGHFGSLAVMHHNITRMSAFGGTADIHAFGDVLDAGEIIVTQWPASIRPAIGTPIFDQI